MRSDRKVSVPEGEIDGLRVERFEVPEKSLENLRNAFAGRSTQPGTYTMLSDERGIWMSDTHAEMRDHMEAVWQIERSATRSVLINGLGIGMIVKTALDCDHVEKIDVVEIDKRVIALVGPHYDDPRLTIHHADAYEQMTTWAKGSHWDVAWHDIWRNMCEDNLSGMARLHRSYGRRVGWQGSWSKSFLVGERRRTANAPWR